MHDHPSITLPIPPAQAFEWDPHYIAVPDDVVYHTIDALRC
jgi:hypothetical protein